MCGYVGRNARILEYMADHRKPLSEWPFGLYMRFDSGDGLRTSGTGRQMASKFMTCCWGDTDTRMMHSADGIDVFDAQ